MKSAGCWLCAMIAGMIFSQAAFAGELSREINLIEKLGKAETDRAKRAAEPPTAAEIQAAAKNIDQYVEQYHKEHKITPNPRTSDEAFLRRIYLDVAGRIPTLQETMTFRKESAPDKRAKLIDKLLDSEAYVSHNFNFWADALRIQSGAYGGQAYANWIKQSLRDNKPYDKMVYELITASGYPWENGAAGYYLRDEDMPLDNMALTVQTFLGTSLVCAQCHNHPFDQWTQYEFYQLAAFTYGVQTRMTSENVKAAQEMLKSDEAGRRALDNIVRPLQYSVGYNDRKLQLPHDYQYSDHQPKDAVSAKTIFGGKAEPASEGQGLREAYANWIIARQNPRFTLTVANRLWKKVMGVGLIEPIDQMTSASVPSNPALMAFLAHKMESYNYDIKQYQRVLYNTQLYQRQVSIEDTPEGETYHFPGPQLRRMSAEQMWDSLVTLVIPQPDYRRGEMSDGDYYKQMIALKEASPESLVAMARERAAYDTARREINDKLREARKDKNAKMIESLNKELAAIKQPSMMPMMAMMDKDKDKDKDAKSKGKGSDKTAAKSSKSSPGGEMESMDLGYGYSIPTKDARIWEGTPAYFVRASEKKSPTDFGSFLRDFGQSDREVINNANTNATLIQVLTMFNGPVFNEVIADYSQLMENIKKVNTPADKVDLIFLTVLSREATSDEKRVIEAAILKPAYQKGWQPDYGKIVWALLNTREFSFIQ